MGRITVTDVRAVLEEVAQAEPDHTDPRVEDDQPVRYLVAGQPSCLVARVLSKLGFSTGILRALDRERPTGEIIRVGVKVAESRHPALRKIDARAIALLQYVQTKQDQGRPWGRIVRDAFSPGPWYSLRERNKPWLS